MIHHASNIPAEKQTDDLTVPVELIGSFLSKVDSIFPSGFPEGKFEYYVETDTRQRVSKTEERLANTDLHEIETSLRKAGEVHKEVRSYVQSKIRPGMRYWDICCDLEDKVRLLIGENGPSVSLFFASVRFRREWGSPQASLQITSRRTTRRTQAIPRFSSTTTW